MRSWSQSLLYAVTSKPEPTSSKSGRFQVLLVWFSKAMPPENFWTVLLRAAKRVPLHYVVLRRHESVKAHENNSRPRFERSTNEMVARSCVQAE
jgi:hypothetical protein